jgi:putative DNA primase/helicase
MTHDDALREVAQLTQLDDLRYALERIEAAKRLGLPVGQLDKAVTAARANAKTARKATAAAMQSNGLPTIHVEAGKLSELATMAEDALIKSGIPIFQRAKRLVRPATQEVAISKGRTTLSACFVDITVAGMMDLLSQTANWTCYDGRLQETVPTDPPFRVAEVLLSRVGEWGFPHVSGIITTPTLRPDHTILDKPGYDSATKLYLVPDTSLKLPPIPKFPTKNIAMEALARLDKLLDGFPFVSAVDRSVALSALLTPICRGAISVAPLHAFNASTAGSGKTYLGDTASVIATGRRCPATAAGSDTAETDKRLTGVMLAGYPIACLDNVNGELGSDLLCQVTELPTVGVRRLGLTGQIEVISATTFFANGNGLRIRGDMTRRALVCDLDAEMERPELREFTFDPVELVLADRGRYVADCLTVVSAFVRSGEKPVTSLASYEEYNKTVRGALVWLGRADPALSMERAREDDPELGELREVMAHWLHYVGLTAEVTAKALITTAELHKRNEEGRQLPELANPELHDCLSGIAGGRGGIDSSRFGKWLRSRKGKIVTMPIGAGRQERVRFENRGTTEGKARWRLTCLK